MSPIPTEPGVSNRSPIRLNRLQMFSITMVSGRRLRLVCLLRPKKRSLDFKPMTSLKYSCLPRSWWWLSSGAGSGRRLFHCWLLCSKTVDGNQSRHDMERCDHNDTRYCSPFSASISATNLQDRHIRQRAAPASVTSSFRPLRVRG